MNIEKKYEVDGATLTFILRKPKFRDTMDAMKKAELELDFTTRQLRQVPNSASKFALFTFTRMQKCIVSPEEFKDADKLLDLPEHVVQDLINTVDSETVVSPPTNAPSSPA